MQRSLESRAGLIAIWQAEGLVAPIAAESWSGKGPFTLPPSIRVREGIRPVLGSFREFGFTNLAITRYPEEIARQALERAELADHFSGIHPEGRGLISYQTIAAGQGLSAEQAARQMVVIGDRSTTSPDIAGLVLIQAAQYTDSVDGASGEEIRAVVEALLEEKGNFSEGFALLGGFPSTAVVRSQRLSSGVYVSFSTSLLDPYSSPIKGSYNKVKID